MRSQEGASASGVVGARCLLPPLGPPSSSAASTLLQEARFRGHTRGGGWGRCVFVGPTAKGWWPWTSPQGLWGQGLHLEMGRGSPDGSRRPCGGPTGPRHSADFGPDGGSRRPVALGASAWADGTRQGRTAVFQAFLLP